MATRRKRGKPDDDEDEEDDNSTDNINIVGNNNNGRNNSKQVTNEHLQPNLNSTTSSSSSTSSPQRKRRRRSGKKNVIPKKLGALSKSQIIELIEQLCEEDESLESRVLKNIPGADLSTIEEELENLMKKIRKAFPWTRFGSSRDHFSWKRVKPAIDTYKQYLQSNTVPLKKSGDNDTFVRYLCISCQSVARLPVFDQDKDNAHLRVLTKHLAAQFKHVLKPKNVRVTEDRLRDAIHCLETIKDATGSDQFNNALENIKERLSISSSNTNDE